MNSEAHNEDDVSANVTDSSAPDNNVSEDNATPIKEENDFEMDSEQDDPTGKIKFYKITVYNSMINLNINKYITPSTVSCLILPKTILQY